MTKPTPPRDGTDAGPNPAELLRRSEYHDRFVEHTLRHRSDDLGREMLRQEWHYYAGLMSVPAEGARVLDLACGSGRNAVALAGHGARVIGLDLLPDALVRARELADHDPRGVHLAAHLGLVVADATRPLPFRLASFDVIAGFRYLDRALFAVLVPFLVPGGELWWETFGPGQARFGHPRRAEFLLGPGELPVLCAAAGLEVLAAQDHEDPGGAGPVLSAVRARRPMR